MKRFRSSTYLACASIIVAAFTGSAGAANTSTYTFYDCVGPEGTPETFTAVKTATPPASGAAVSSAAAFRLTDSRLIFVVLSFGEGNFSPPGISISGNAVVTCSVDLTSGTTQFSGLLAPAR